jgi:hypothetical protein
MDEAGPKEEGVALAPGGPYLVAALLCERVLDEKDNVKTLVRIVDRVLRHVAGPAPPEQMEPFEYDCAIYLRFRCGRVSGPRQVRVDVARPDGGRQTIIHVPVRFEEGDTRFADVVLRLIARFDTPGLYWFLVYFEDELAARIPFTVEYIPIRTLLQGAG